MTESRTAVYCKHNLHTPHPKNGVEMDETQMQAIMPKGNTFRDTLFIFVTAVA